LIKTKKKTLKKMSESNGSSHNISQSDHSEGAWLPLDKNRVLSSGNEDSRFYVNHSTTSPTPTTTTTAMDVDENSSTAPTNDSFLTIVHPSPPIVLLEHSDVHPATHAHGAASEGYTLTKSRPLSHSPMRDTLSLSSWHKAQSKGAGVSVKPASSAKMVSVHDDSSSESQEEDDVEEDESRNSQDSDPDYMEEEEQSHTRVCFIEPFS
jgi:hypothetical protein